MRLKIERGINKVLKPLDLKLVRRGDGAASAKQKRIIFFHVPKCGGSSIGNGLRSAFGHENVEERRENFNLDAKAARQSANALQIPMAAQNQVLLRYALEKNIRLVQGHFLYDRMSVNGLGNEWHSLTILRDPRSHILSGYYYDRYKPRGREHFGIETELEEWLETPHARGYGVAFIRYFVGEPEIADTIVNYTNESTEMQEAVDKAIKNLETFTAIGDIGNVGAFESKLEEKFNKKIKFEKLKRSPAGSYPRFPEQNKNVQDKILELCAPNIKIYEHVFRAELAGREQLAEARAG